MLKFINVSELYSLPDKTTRILDGNYVKLSEMYKFDTTGDVDPLDDRANELMFLGYLIDSKKFKYGTDPAIIEYPLTAGDITNYYTNFATLSMLNKSIFVHLYYMFHDEDDSYALYNTWLSEMNTFYSDNNVETLYKLIVSIYSMVIQNDVYDQKLSVTGNQYPTDYWSND